MNAIADLQKLIDEKRNLILGDNDILEYYNILDVEIKKLKPRESAFSIISRISIILISVLIISANGILITLLNLFRISSEILPVIILSVVFWIAVVIFYIKFEEPLNFVRQSFTVKLKDIKSELISYMHLQIHIIEEITARNIMFKKLEKIKREKQKIEKYLQKRDLSSY
jgi:hypothetical protein